MSTSPASAAAVAPAAAAGAGHERAAQRRIHYAQWDDGPELRAGTTNGVKVERGRLRIASPTSTRALGDTSYELASWDSPWVEPGFAFGELIASWSALTPGNSFVEVRVTLARKAGTALAPSIDAVGAVTSRLPDSVGAVSAPGVARGITLDVPKYSQMVHEGDYPQWNGGGEAWCSPTSTSMVLGYYDALPPKTSYAWVPKGHVDPWVDHAARMTFDYDYDGTGNWPFNTAYAAPRVGKAFVTRLRSLREAERFIAAGIPLVASISFGSGELDGAPISSTAGHLIVIVGFTDDGDVVVNDPASRDRAGVRRTYDRGQLERAWLGGSGGTVYVIHDTAHPLPEGKQTNW